MKTKEPFCRMAVGLAAALIIAAIGLVAYIVIDLALHPTDMPLVFLAVPPLTSLAAGALLAWCAVTRRARAAGDERLVALAWGAGASLLALALTVGIFSLLVTLARSASVRGLTNPWLGWVPIAGVSAVLSVLLVRAVRARVSRGRPRLYPRHSALRTVS